MGRYHEIVLAYEGTCAMCGACCRGCESLRREGRKWVCGDHPNKASQCIMFPIGYSLDLVPEECALRITRTVRVDETTYDDRIRVSGRAGLSFVTGVDEDGKPADLQDIQRQVDKKHKKRIYGLRPLALAQDVVKLAQALVHLEEGRLARADVKPRGDLSLSFAEYRRAEKEIRELIEAICAYATRRDIIMGDLFQVEAKKD